jgi:hypothetical protein
LVDLPFVRTDKIFIVGCAEDNELLQAYSGWDEQIVSTEFILAGSLRQRLDFSGNRLHVKAARPRAKKRH